MLHFSTKIAHIWLKLSTKRQYVVVQADLVTDNCRQVYVYIDATLSSYIN